MAAAEVKTISPSTPWDLTELTASQWRQLESRLDDEERATLEGLRKQWVNAALLLEAWLDPVLYETYMSYDRALAAVENAENEFREFVARMRREYRI